MSRNVEQLLIKRYEEDENSFAQWLLEYIMSNNIDANEIIAFVKERGLY